MKLHSEFSMSTHIFLVERFNFLTSVFVRKIKPGKIPGVAISLLNLITVFNTTLASKILKLCSNTSPSLSLYVIINQFYLISGH